MIRWITTIAVLISAALIAPLTHVTASLTTTDDQGHAGISRSPHVQCRLER